MADADGQRRREHDSARFVRESNWICAGRNGAEPDLSILLETGTFYFTLTTWPAGEGKLTALSFRHTEAASTAARKEIMKRIRGALLVVLPLCVAGQEIVIDWPNRALVGCPGSSGSRSQATVRVTGINDILYQYDVQAKVTTVQPDDYSLFANAVIAAPPLEAGADECAMNIKKAIDLAEAVRQQFEGDTRLRPKASAGKYLPVFLADTIVAWSAFTARGGKYAELLKVLGAIRAEGCEKSIPADNEAAYRDVGKLVNGWMEFQRKVNQPHEALRTVGLTVGADSKVVVTVAEFFVDDGGNRQPVASKVFEECVLSSDVLTLSVGPLFSAVPNRVYSRQQLYPVLPVADANGRAVLGPDGKPNYETSTNYYNGLVATGSNLNTVGVALLNYRFPWANRHWMSLSASVGPTFRFAGQDQKSSRLGLFTGLSFGMWRRLFITPGVHVGEFADFPAGLAPGSTIPAGYPDAQLDGIPRWTAKFGVAISVQTKAFKNLDIGLLKEKSTGGSAKPPAKSDNPAPPNTPAAPSNPAAPPSTPAPSNPAAPPSTAAPASMSPFTPRDAGPRGTPAMAGPRPGVPPVQPAVPVTPDAAPAVVPAAVQLGKPSFDGSACRGGSLVPSYAVSDQAVLSIAWDSFSIDGAGGKPVQADCQVQVPVTVAAGKRIALTGADYVGSVSVGQDQSLTFRVTLSRHGSGESVMNVSRSYTRSGPATDSFPFGVRLPQRDWSACGASTMLVFRAELNAKPTGANPALSGAVNSFRFDVNDSRHLAIEDCTGR